MANLDLGALWEGQTRCEFETRDANATMATKLAKLAASCPAADLSRCGTAHILFAASSTT